MNDRFKFRFWHNNLKKMFEVYSFDKNFVQATESLVVPNIKIFKISDGELLQCTGLKDKNGTLIFEGDIVKLEDELNCIAQFHKKYDMDYGRIEFILIDGNPKYPTVYIPTVAKESEVIGNIHENSEFLVECSDSETRKSK